MSYLSPNLALAAPQLLSQAPITSRQLEDLFFGTFLRSTDTLRNYVSAHNVDSTLAQIRRDLFQFEHLTYAAARSFTLRESILVSTAAFDGKQRENRDEPSVWHSHRTSDQLAQLLGHRAIRELVDSELHDTIEDCGMEKWVIETAFKQAPEQFGKVVARDVDDLSLVLHFPPNPDDAVKAGVKFAAKKLQTRRLSTSGLLVKAKDNLDEIDCNNIDFENEMLVRTGNNINRVKPRTTGKVSVFNKKLDDRLEHGIDYIKLIRQKGSAAFGGKSVDLRLIADIFESELAEAVAIQRGHLGLASPTIRASRPANGAFLLPPGWDAFAPHTRHLAHQKHSPTLIFV